MLSRRTATDRPTIVARWWATRHVLAFCVCLAFVPGAAAQGVKPAAQKPSTPVAVEEPRDVVAAIYERLRTELKTQKPASPIFIRSVREKYFSKGFDLLVTEAETKEAHSGNGLLDFDPITASQDPEPQKVTLKTDLLATGKAVVSASFTNRGQPTVVTYDFVKEDGAWRVDDIKGTTEKEAWSVRKILKRAGKEPKTLPGMKDAGDKPDAVKPLPPKRP